MEPDYNDPFCPIPTLNRTVRCLHCGDTFPETEAVFEERRRFYNPASADVGLWWCKHITCDGAGVGWDLIPISTQEARS